MHLRHVIVPAIVKNPQQAQRRRPPDAAMDIVYRRSVGTRRYAVRIHIHTPAKSRQLVPCLDDEYLLMMRAYECEMLVEYPACNRIRLPPFLPRRQAIYKFDRSLVGVLHDDPSPLVNLGAQHHPDLDPCLRLLCPHLPQRSPARKRHVDIAEPPQQINEIARSSRFLDLALKLRQRLLPIDQIHDLVPAALHRNRLVRRTILLACPLQRIVVLGIVRNHDRIQLIQLHPCVAFGQHLRRISRLQFCFVNPHESP